MSRCQRRERAPTLGTFYLCFSDLHGHTRWEDLLNKTPPGDWGVNKHSQRVNKVWRNCQPASADADDGGGFGVSDFFFSFFATPLRC